MKFSKLLQVIADEPVFASALLLAGDIEPGDVRRQLSRWVQSGRLYQLRRGLYALAPPYQKIKPHPFLVANQLVHGSYVSLQSALAYYGLIPEYVPLTTSVAAHRPGTWHTPLGDYDFRHIQPTLLAGYQRYAVSPSQSAFVATPEKALFDLAYLYPNADSPAYVRELRLQNLDQLNLDRLHQWVKVFASPKLARFANQVAALAQSESIEYEIL